MLLAGDVGGTKTLLGLFSRAPERPVPIDTRQFTTLDFEDLGAMIDEFVSEQGHRRKAIEAACFGVAGPVRDQVARLTNVPWHVDAVQVADRFSIGRVRLLNDLEAMSHAVPVFEPDEVAVLQDSDALPTGNGALIRSRHRPRRGAVAQRRWPVCACRVRGRPRRLRCPDPARDRARARTHPDLRPRPLRACHLGSRAREHRAIRSPGRRLRCGRPELAAGRTAGVDLSSGAEGKPVQNASRRWRCSCRRSARKPATSRSARSPPRVSPLVAVSHPRSFLP